MPKLLQINAALNKGSTGRIAEQIAALARRNGWDTYMMHGARYVNASEMHTFQVVTSLIIRGVLLDSGAELLEIVDTACPSAPFSGSIECRKQYRRQNGNDGNNHEKFDQGKAHVLYPNALG